jgi:hypothetical protein
MKLNRFAAFAAMLSAVVIIIIGTPPTGVKAQAPAELTVILRDSHGTPLQSVLCEVLSYDWQVPIGQPYAIVAKGQTDASGAVRFDVGKFPRTGYRFKFTKTAQTLPADTYFVAPESNQYRGFPAATIGGRAETAYFVIADGLPYNDITNGAPSPDWQKNPVGGLQQPRVSVMPADQYLATVAARSASASTGQQPPAATAAPTLAQRTLPPPAAATGAPPVPVSSYQSQPDPTPNILVLGLLALCGIAIVVLVVLYREAVGTTLNITKPRQSQRQQPPKSGRNNQPK